MVFVVYFCKRARCWISDNKYIAPIKITKVAKSLRLLIFDLRLFCDFNILMCTERKNPPNPVKIIPTLRKSKPTLRKSIPTLMNARAALDFARAALDYARVR